MVISVGRDTAEPLADVCMLGGLLAYRHARYVLAALLVTYGVITNEPILVVAVAIALPFKALVPAVVHDFRLMSWTHLGMYDFNLMEFIALAAFVVAGLLVLRSTTAPYHARALLSG